MSTHLPTYPHVPTIEEFPNKLFHIIFLYLYLSKIFHSFANLNSRFQSAILSLTRAHLTINRPDDFDHPSNIFATSLTSHLVVRHSAVIPFDHFYFLRCIKNDLDK